MVELFINFIKKNSPNYKNIKNVLRTMYKEQYGMWITTPTLYYESFKNIRSLQNMELKMQFADITSTQQDLQLNNQLIYQDQSISQLSQYINQAQQDVVPEQLNQQVQQVQQYKQQQNEEIAQMQNTHQTEKQNSIQEQNQILNKNIELPKFENTIENKIKQISETVILKWDICSKALQKIGLTDVQNSCAGGSFSHTMCLQMRTQNCSIYTHYGYLSKVIRKSQFVCQLINSHGNNNNGQGGVLYLDTFNFVAICQNSEMLKYDFNNVSHKTIDISTTIEKQDNTGYQQQYKMLNPKSYNANIQTPGSGSDGVQVCAQDGLIRGEITLSVFEKYALEAIDTLISQGKSFDSAIVYWDYFKGKQHWSLVIILLELFEAFLEMQKIFVIDEFKQKYEQYKDTMFNLQYLLNMPAYLCYEAVYQLHVMVKEYPNKVQQALKQKQEMQIEQAKKDAEAQIQQKLNEESQRINNENNAKIQQKILQQQQEFENWQKQLPDLQKAKHADEAKKKILDINANLERVQNLKTLGMIRRHFKNLKLKEKKEIISDKKDCILNVQHLEIGKGKGVLVRLLYQSKQQHKSVSGSKEYYDSYQAMEQVKSLRKSGGEVEMCESDVSIEYDQISFKNSIELLNHLIRENVVVSLVLPVDDAVSPFSKESYLWAFSGSCRILMPWHTQKLVNIVLINLDNCQTPVKIIQRIPSTITIPAFDVTIQQIPRLSQESFHVMSLNAVHNMPTQKDCIQLIKFGIDDALYAHAKFSKVDRRDVLYTTVTDAEEAREAFIKGRLIAEYVGFQIQKDKLGEFIDTFKGNKKYTTCDMEEDGITLLVGEEVFDGYECNIEELKKRLQTNNIGNNIGTKMIKIENMKDRGQLNIEAASKRIQVIEQKLSKIKIENPTMPVVHGMAMNQSAEEKLKGYEELVDKIIQAGDKDEFVKAIASQVVNDIMQFKEVYCTKNQ